RSKHRTRTPRTPTRRQKAHLSARLHPRLPSKRKRKARRTNVGADASVRPRAKPASPPPSPAERSYNPINADLPRPRRRVRHPAASRKRVLLRLRTPPASTYQRLSTQDHALTTELVMGVLRWRS